MIVPHCFVLLVLCFFGRVAFADGVPADWVNAQRMEVYEVSKVKDNRAAWQYRLGQVGVAGDGNFAASAHVAFKIEPRPTVVESLDMVFANRRTELPSGWKLLGEELFAWQGEAGQGKKLHLPLDVKWNDKRDRDLSSYDALWVDYSVLSGLDVCQPNLMLDGRSQPWSNSSPVATERWQAQTDNHGSIKLLHRIDAREVPWQARDNAYLLGCVLHWKPDSHWRYVGGEKDVVLQRRMHLNLDHAIWLDVALEPGFVIAHINLSVRGEDDYAAGDLIKIHNLPAPSLLPDGRLGVRVNLRELLKQRFPDRFSKESKGSKGRVLYLQEVFLFVPGEVSQIAATRPLRELVLWGSDAVAGAHTLPTQHQRLNAHMQRMVVDLGAIARRAKFSMENAAMVLQPATTSSSCAIRIESVRLVSMYDEKIPAYVKGVEDWSRRWGGPFKLVVPWHDQVEQPGILRYLPLDLLTDPLLRQDRGDVVFESVKNEVGAVTTPTTYRILGESRKNIETSRYPTGPSGTVLSAKGDASPLAGRAGRWLFDSSSTQLNLDWPVNVSIGPDTWFYLGVDGAEQLGGVDVTLLTAEGQRLFRQVALNQPVHLVQGATNVTGIQLAINPRALPYRLNLRELVLFEPSVIDYAQALRLPLPASVSLAPKPVPASGETGLLEMRSGHVVGVAGNKKVQFSTVMETPLHGVRGLSLSYRLPSAYERNGECFLQVRMNWEKESILRQFCPHSHDDKVFVPLAAWLSEAEAGRDLGALRSIDWAVSLPGQSAWGTVETFSLDFAIEGWGNLSVADRLWRSPLFHVGGGAVSADISGMVDGMLGRARKIWLPIEAGALSRIITAKGEISPAENALVELEQIAVQPVKALDWKAWERFVKPQVTSPPPRWPKILLWSSVLLLAWASARKGWWSPGRAWLYTKGVAYLLYWLVSRSIGYAGRRIWCALPWTRGWEDRLPGLGRWLGWFAVTCVLYGSGLFQPAQRGGNYFFTFGGMTALLFLRASFLLLEPRLRRIAPNTAAHVFDGAGSLYFSGAIVGLVGTALLLAVKLDPIAEQLAVVVYYCLVVGAVLEIVALRHANREQTVLGQAAHGESSV